MNLNDLLAANEIDPTRPKHVLIMRHRPKEPAFRKIFPWLAAERPELFNAYQQSQSPGAEEKLARAKYLISFIGHEAAKALFVGIYEVRGS